MHCVFPSGYLRVALGCHRSTSAHQSRGGAVSSIHHTSPGRQSQVSSAVVSSSTLTGMTNNAPSSSGVRVTPVGLSVDEGPCHGSQPRETYSDLPAFDEESAPNWYAPRSTCSAASI